MIFTKLARIVAWLALIAGAGQLAIGVGIASEFLGPYDAALARYAPGAANSGDVIDRGLYVLIFAISLGALAEISRSVQQGQKKMEDSR
ncbi:UNVERIFIED_ORG: diacylglycerol kinase family enzyme [Rhizobium esperanzae]